MKRNRSEGWAHAKKSGHQNEKLVQKQIESDQKFRSNLSKKINKKLQLSSVEITGIHEESTISILGAKTKSKTDLKLTWSDSSKTNISIKKSGSGQVFLIKASRFIYGYEKHYETIPDKVKRALLLYFGEAEDTKELLLSLKISKMSIREYELRKNSLVWTSLQEYDKKLSFKLLEWLRGSIKNITDFCFSRGLVKDQQEWAKYIWYINLLKENSFNHIYDMSNLSHSCEKNRSEIIPGNRTGGSTIWLPFGFVQWHQNSMQFHHKFEKIDNMINLKQM